MVILLGWLQAGVVIFLLFTGWVCKGVDFTLYRVWVPLSWLQVGVDVVNSEVIYLGRLLVGVVILWLFAGWVGMGIDFTLYRVWVPLSWLQAGVEVVISEVSQL